MFGKTQSPAISSTILIVAILAGSASGRAALEVRGRVVDEAGEPIARASVELSPYPRRSERARSLLAGHRYPQPITTVQTSADGRYLVRVPESGMWKLVVHSPGRISVGQYLLPLTGDRDLPDAELREAAGVVIRVVDEGGEAVPMAQVRIEPVDVFRSRARTGGWWEEGRLAVTNDEGRLEFARRVGESLQATAWARGFVPSAKVTVSGSSGVVRLVRGKQVTLRFLESGKTPVAGALVGVDGWQWIGGFSDEDGNFGVWVEPGEPLEYGLQGPEGATYGGSVVHEAFEFERQEHPVEVVALEAPLELGGNVIDAESREPIAGAYVWSGRDSGHFVRTAQDGSYRLREYPQANLRLGSGAVGYETTWAALEGGVDRLSAPLIALSASAVLTGRVVDGDGQGVPSAEVTATLASRWQHPKVTTREDGSFRFEDLELGETYEIVARSPQYAPGRRAVQVLPGAVVEIELARGRSLIGTVVDESKAPVAGAEVRLTPIATDIRSRVMARGQSEPDPVVTDEEGLFRVVGLGDEPMALLAQAAGFADRLITGLPLDGGEPIVDVGEVELEAAVVLQGVVRNRAGSAVEGAEIHGYVDSYVRYMVAGGLEDSLRRTAVSGSDGKFSIDGLPGGEAVTLHVRHVKYVPEEVERVLPEGDAPLAIVLELAAQVSGRVENEEGQPVGGARVRVEPLARKEKLSSPYGGRGEGTGWGRSAQDGTFSVSGVRPGEVDLSAEGSGYVSAKPLRLTLAAGEERSGALIVLRRGATLEGRVLDSAGGPVLGAALSLMQEESSSFGMTSRSVSHAKTDAGGRFRLEGVDPLAREVVLRVTHADYVDAEERFQFEPGLERVIVLETGSTVVGFVLTEAGSPASGAQVTLETSAGHYSSSDPMTTSLEDGSFEMFGVEAGTYRVAATKPGFAKSVAETPVEVGSDPVRGVTVYLKRGGTIFGSISGIEPAELDQLQVVIRGDSGGMMSFGLVDAEGEYRAVNVPESRGVVMASSQASGRYVSEPFELDVAGGETRVDLVFPAGSTLSGTVRFEGEPWAGVFVSVEGGARTGGGTQTSQTGRFEVRGLADGPYRILISERGGTSHVELVEISGDTEVAIDVRSVGISGRVTASDTAEPIAGATVLVDGERLGRWAPRGAQAATSAQGEYRLRVSAGETATLRARAPGYAEATTSVSLSAGDSIGVDFELEPAADLELRVKLWSGIEPRTLNLAVVDESGRRILAQFVRSAGGSYHVNSVPPGRWRLLLQADESALLAAPIEMPSPPLDLVLPEGARIEVNLEAIAETAGLGKLRVMSTNGSRLQIPAYNSIQSEWPVTGVRTMISGVPPGDWVVEFVSDSGAAWRQTVTSTAGETVEARFE